MRMMWRGLQLVMNSTDEAAPATCTVSVLDSQMQVTDTHVLTFSVNANPPGEVCITALTTVQYQAVLCAPALSIRAHKKAILLTGRLSCRSYLRSCAILRAQHATRWQQSTALPQRLSQLRTMERCQVLSWPPWTAAPTLLLPWRHSPST